MDGMCETFVTPASDRQEDLRADMLSGQRMFSGRVVQKLFERILCANLGIVCPTFYLQRPRGQRCGDTLSTNVCVEDVLLAFVWPATCVCIYIYIFRAAPERPRV